MSGFRIALRVLRVDRRTRVSAILTAAGVAVATALMLLLVSLLSATDARSGRSAWQDPMPGGSDTGTLALSTSVDVHEGTKIARVDVAALGAASRIALPEGIERFPGPGEVLLSPELARLADSRPASALKDRFPGEVVGSIGSEALSHEGQLVALVGNAPSDMPQSVSRQDGFATSEEAGSPMLELLAGVGFVVLAVPSLVLVASAARLTAARRESRLSALRLAGATPRQVLSTVAGEMTFAAVGGALFGYAVSPLLHSLAKYVPWGGGTWQASDFTVPLTTALPVVLAIPLLVLLAAVLGLRRVVREPLGAAGGSRAAKRPHWWRLLTLPTAMAFFFYLLEGSLGHDPTLLLFSLLLILASAALIGPWVTAAVGAVFVRGWHRPSLLLAGRRLREDPKGAYRSSAGVVLAVFTGSMALTLLPSFESLAGSDSPLRKSVLYISTTTERAERIVEDTDETLRRYGQDERALLVPRVRLESAQRTRRAYVLDCDSARRIFHLDSGSCAGTAPGVHNMGGPGSAGTTVVSGESSVRLSPDIPTYGHSGVSPRAEAPVIVEPAALPASVEPGRAMVAVTPNAENREVLRTALVRASDGGPVRSVRMDTADDRAQLADLRRVTVLGLAVATLLSGCSAAIATAGSVMDRRRTFGSLLAAGTSVRALSTALRTEAAMPALVATIGAGTVGVVVGLGFFDAVSRAAPVIEPWVAAPVVLGIGAAFLAASVCRPALRRINTEPLADE